MIPQFKTVGNFFHRNKQKILIILICLLELFSISLSGFSMYLTKLFWDGSNSSSSSFNWLGLSVVGLCLSLICIIGLRGATMINLDWLLTYFWGIAVFIAPIILGVIACFDFYVYVSTWFKHSWDLPTFYQLREIFCKPGTASTLCVAPVLAPGSPVTIDSWCMSNFNSTECSSIRETAILSATTYGRYLALGQASAATLILLVIMITIFICYRMLTVVVITESMNDIINYLLLLPIGACISMAIALWNWTNYKGFEYSWIARLFVALSAGQTVALPLGIIAGRLKSQAMLTFYLVLIFLCIVGLAVSGSYGLLYAGLMSKDFKPSLLESSKIACQMELSGCCCCDKVDSYNGIGCPEWNQEEIISLLVLQLKIYGVVSFLCILYLVGALVVASFVRRSLKNYKTDYI